MSGVATSCKDNPRLGRVGCGAAYGGNRVHCTNPADWSTSPDGLCHQTFSTYSAFDKHIHFDGSAHRHPADVVTKEGERVLHPDERGTWRQAGDNPFADRTPGGEG